MSGLGPVWIGAVIAAVISSLVTAAGWLVTHRREADAAARQRRARVIDVQKAIRAEIRAHRLQLEQNDPAAHLNAIRAALANDPAFTPIPPREARDIVFRTLLPDIHLLNSDGIEAVVSYYSQVHAAAALAEDLRTPLFQALETRRRAQAYSDYFEMKVTTLTLARAAEAALDDIAGRAA